jgi:hypothetical protein
MLNHSVFLGGQVKGLLGKEPADPGIEEGKQFGIIGLLSSVFLSLRQFPSLFNSMQISSTGWFQLAERSVV